MPPEQHHPQEAGSQKKGCQHFVGQEGASHAPSKIGKLAPIGTQLVGHDNVGRQPHSKIEGKDSAPVEVQLVEYWISDTQPALLQNSQIAGQPEGDGRKRDME